MSFMQVIKPIMKNSVVKTTNGDAWLFCDCADMICLSFYWNTLHGSDGKN